MNRGNAFEFRPNGGDDMHGYDMMSGWGGMWFGPVLMVLAPLAFILLIIWLVRTMTKRTISSPAQNTGARQILDERYAKGEIDDEEYQRRRSALDG
jgi:putative membrane protein